MQFKGTEQNDLVKSVIEASKKIASSKNASVDLSKLHFTKVQEIQTDGKKKALVIYVPVKEIEQYKADFGVVESLEKNLNGYQVHIVGDRTAVRRIPKYYRPYCRTKASVQENLFEDLIFPAHQTGKRIHYSNGDSKHQFFISKTRQTELKDRVAVISKVYESLTKVKNTIDFM